MCCTLFIPANPYIHHSVNLIPFLFVDSDDEDDTLVTAGLSSPLGALSPWGSSPDLTRHTPIGSVDGECDFIIISTNFNVVTAALGL